MRLADLFTTTRVIGTAALFFVEPLSLPFYCVYTLCGASDILDGFVARKTHTATRNGALYDTVADFFFVITVLFRLSPYVPIASWMVVWFCIILAIKTGTMVIGAVKFQSFVLLHTVLNKVTGFLLYLLPFVMTRSDFPISLFVVAIVATLASAEELYLILKQKLLNRNVKSAFF